MSSNVGIIGVKNEREFDRNQTGEETLFFILKAPTMFALGSTLKYFFFQSRLLGRKNIS
jgi:hypothetical protein